MAGWQVLSERAEQQHGVVTLDDLLMAGYSYDRVAGLVRREHLVGVGAGVWRIAGVPLSFEARALGAIWGASGPAWASHDTAIRLWRGRPGTPGHTIEITRPYGCSAGRSTARVHRSTRIPAHHVTTHHGIPLTTPARTLFDLARRFGPRQLGRLVEETLRADLCTIGSLHRVTAELGGRGRPGTRRMRDVLATRDVDYVPTSSELTAVGRAVLAGTTGIEWEVRLSDEQGYIRQVDALIRPAGVVIEFDGARFHGQPSDVRHDAATDARLVAAGYVVYRCDWNALVHRPETTRATVERLARVPT